MAKRIYILFGVVLLVGAIWASVIFYEHRYDEFAEDENYCKSVNDCLVRNNDCTYCSCDLEAVNIYSLGGVCVADDYCDMDCLMPEIDCVENECMIVGDSDDIDYMLYCENDGDCLVDNSDCSGCSCNEFYARSVHVNINFICNADKYCDMDCEVPEVSCVENECVIIEELDTDYCEVDEDCVFINNACFECACDFVAVSNEYLSLVGDRDCSETWKECGLYCEIPRGAKCVANNCILEH